MINSWTCYSFYDHPSKRRLLTSVTEAHCTSILRCKSSLHRVEIGTLLTDRSSNHTVWFITSFLEYRTRKEGDSIISTERVMATMLVLSCVGSCKSLNYADINIQWEHQVILSFMLENLRIQIWGSHKAQILMNTIAYICSITHRNLLFHSWSWKGYTEILISRLCYNQFIVSTCVSCSSLCDMKMRLLTGL